MSPTVRRCLVALAGAALLALAAACGQSAAPGAAPAPGGGDALVFAAVPSEEATSLQQSYAAVIAMLEKETGRKIEFQNATDYAAVIEGMRAGKIDIGVFGPFSYILAKGQGADISPVAAIVDAKGEQPGYQSYGIVPAGSPITDLAGYKGKKVCFVDPGSTSGYLYPTAGLLGVGVNPEAGGVEQVFAGGHDASALAVASGQCDAGFAYDTIVDVQLLETGQLKPGQLNVVWKSEIIAGSPVAVSNALEDGVQETITSAFREKANVDHLVANGFCTSVDTCEVGEEGGWGYVPVDDTLYNGVRKVCEVTQAESCRSLS